MLLCLLSVSGGDPTPLPGCVAGYIAAEILGTTETLIGIDLWMKVTLQRGQERTKALNDSVESQ